MAYSDWDPATLNARISDATRHLRHPGGSPDPTEIAAYAAGIPAEAKGTALVLGMTPELRAMAAKRFERLISVERNPASIALYRDWLNPEARAREVIVERDWIAEKQLSDDPVAVVLGDGVFGNLPDVAAHHRLLCGIGASLKPRGRFITRMAMIPDGFDPAAHARDRLISRYRAGEYDAAEFGFGMRFVGHYATCYDPETFTLDNARLFAACAELLAAGGLTADEHVAIRRYYFGGKNCILTQAAWESALTACGFRFRQHRCRGKAWYDYYVVYECAPEIPPTQTHGIRGN